jgi:transposase-like protein/IS1 family transposase
MRVRFPPSAPTSTKAPPVAVTTDRAISTRGLAECRPKIIIGLPREKGKRRKMTCHNCEIECTKSGKNRNGSQRFRCSKCGKKFSQEKPLGTMYLPTAKAVAVLQLLLEGMSIRSAERITGIHRDTILRLLVVAGEKCERLLESKIQNVPVADVESDELWSFCFKKEGHKWANEAHRQDIGDAYCFVGMERNSKLILAWHLGKRTSGHTDVFIRKLANATAQKPYQLSTDGFKPYIKAVDKYLVPRGVDYGQIVKVYGSDREGEQKYSPAEVVSAEIHPVLGLPDRNRICTSHIERQNLSIRMGMRRMTRLTNAFSKKWKNLKAAFALWFAYYNFCRVHKTLRVTPAMEAGIAQHVWSIGEMLI